MESILKLLELIKEKKISGEFIEIALGKNKFPETVKEGYQMLKQELWQKK